MGDVPCRAFKTIHGSGHVRLRGRDDGDGRVNREAQTLQMEMVCRDDRLPADDRQSNSSLPGVGVWSVTYNHVEAESRQTVRG
jgi:hypothetical protein